jgi:hypothetical protein
MSLNNENTPFDDQLNDQLNARRAQPTNAPIRIGADDASAVSDAAPSPTANATPAVPAPVVAAPPLALPTSPGAPVAPAPVTAPSAANAAPVAPTTPNATGALFKERVPMPVLIGLAMALGALFVVVVSIGIRRLITPAKPVYPTSATRPPAGNVVMGAPEVVIKNPTPLPASPGGERQPQIAQAPPIDGADSDQPELTIEEVEPVQEESPRARRREEPEPERSRGEDSDRERRKEPERARETERERESAPARRTSEPEPSREVYPAAESHRRSDYEISPPPGFRLRQSGRRTIWQRDDGSQILVETGKAGAGSPRQGWEDLDRRLAKKYGNRYRSLGIRETTLAGHPAAVWEFELTGKNGQTQRKVDIAIKVNGRGYAVLGAAPADKFDRVRGDLESAINSFRVNPGAQRETEVEEKPREERRRRRAPAPEPTPEPTSEVPQTESPQPQERGY